MKKLIILTALTTALFADCNISGTTAFKEANKALEYQKNQMMPEACFSNKVALSLAIDAKLSCKDLEMIQIITKLENHTLSFNKRYCK